MGKLVVAIGNVGASYTWTRHNIGFLFADFLLQHMRGTPFKKVPPLFSFVAKGETPLGPVVLIKPTTYVNLSGKAFSAVRKYYQIPSNQILVVADDVNHPLGSTRLRWQGGSGGHKGLKSIRDSLGSSDYWQLRLGVGRPENDHHGLSDFVLGNFLQEEQEQLPNIFHNAEKLFLDWLAQETP